MHQHSSILVSRILICGSHPTRHNYFESLFEANGKCNTDLPATKTTFNTSSDLSQTRSRLQESTENNSKFSLLIIYANSIKNEITAETLNTLWKLDPALKILICADFTEKQWSELHSNANNSYNLLLLQIPCKDSMFKQCANVLLYNWHYINSKEQSINCMKTLLTHNNLKLANEKKKTEQANKIKRQFLSNISHEIRTPMNGIIGMTHLLMQSQLDKEQNFYAKIIRDSADTMLSVLDDILDFSKLETQIFYLEEVDFDLSSTIQAINDCVRQRAEDKNLQYWCTIEQELYPLLRGDPGRLRQILLNLLDNAVKFTESGSVSMQVFEKDSNEKHSIIRFSITDTGIGIESSKIAEMFDFFTQADLSSTRKHSGTGLGLGISYQLIELMKGKLMVQSEPGIGSTFWFDVCFEKQQHKPQSNIANGIDIRELNIMFIDKNLSKLSVLTSYLRSWGCKTPLNASNKNEALKIINMLKATSSPVDVIIIDLDTLQREDKQMVESIRWETSMQNISFMLVSSKNDSDNYDVAKNLLFDAYISAPYDPSNFYNCLISLASNNIYMHQQKYVPKREKPLIPKDIITKESLSDVEPRPEKILLVEDNYINELVVSGILQKHGFNPVCVRNGKKALEILRTCNFDLILMDVQMPIMDGIEATSIIRNNQVFSNKQIPIIAITAHAMDGDRERFQYTGMDDYISKPVSPSKLYEVITKWLASDKYRKQN